MWRSRREGTASSVRALGLSLGLEHGGIERLARRLTGPDYELKGGKITLAGVERSAEQALALATGGLHPAGEHEGVTVHDETVRKPEIEMADPQLLIDH